jgi:hypothetical protein
LPGGVDAVTTLIHERLLAYATSPYLGAEAARYRAKKNVALETPGPAYPLDETEMSLPCSVESIKSVGCLGLREGGFCYGKGRVPGDGQAGGLRRGLG